MKKVILQFGLLATALLALLQLSKFSLLYHGLSKEVWIPLFAVFFIAAGFLFSKFVNINKKQEMSDGRRFDISVSTKSIEKLGISKREYEVLQNISEGLSNQEIAQKLFISESTVKTHVSNILVKLDAKRRTQAVKNAKSLNIL